MHTTAIATENTSHSEWKWFHAGRSQPANAAEWQSYIAPGAARTQPATDVPLDATVAHVQAAHTLAGLFDSGAFPVAGVESTYVTV